MWHICSTQDLGHSVCILPFKQSFTWVNSRCRFKTKGQRSETLEDQEELGFDPDVADIFLSKSHGPQKVHEFFKWIPVSVGQGVESSLGKSFSSLQQV